VSRHRPELLRDRIPCGEEEEFLSWHFPSGERRDAARLLWRLLENQFDVDLRGLHPDDDLSSVIHGGGYESLNTVELVMALEELVDSESPTRQWKRISRKCLELSDRWSIG
jgi:acyl carrier protein